MSKLSFRERVLRAYAAVMKKLFPIYCVKNKTLKRKSYYGTWGTTSNHDGLLFLPGKDKELEAIEKLQFDAKALNDRYWSMDTKIALLKKGNFAMVDRIKTEEEVKAVVEQGYITPICEAIKVCTPSKEYLLSLIQRWNKEEKLFTLIANVPSAFNSLAPWEVLGVEEDKAYEDKEMWPVAQALVKAKPTLAAKYIKEVIKIVPTRLNEEAKVSLKFFVEVAVEKKVDISEGIAYLMVIHPSLYAYVRSSLAKETSSAVVAPYVRVMFPQVVNWLDARFDSMYSKDGPTAWVSSSDKQCDAKEAAAWLYLALSSGTINLIISKISLIKRRLSSVAFSDIEGIIFLNVKEISDIVSLMDFYQGQDEELGELREKLLKPNQASGALRKFYPFRNWKDEQAEKAVRILAKAKELPENLSELSAELQKVAMEELEIQSEISVLKGSSSADKAALVEQKLHSSSEVVLFTNCYETLETYGFSYVQNFCMDESTFKVIVEKVRDDRGYEIDSQLRRLITLHAEKWGLSPKNYKDLMQSHYSGLAPTLKKYRTVENDK